MQTYSKSFLPFSLVVLFISIPVFSFADSTSVDDFTAIVNTGTVTQTTQGSGNQQNLNVGSATAGTKAKSFNANVTTGTITQSSSGSGIVQSTNIGSATNSKVGSFNSTVNTGNIEQIANQSGMRQELDIGSVTNSTVSGAVNTNVTLKDGVRQTGSGAIAIGSVKNANVQNFTNTVNVKGKVTGDNVKIGSVVGQSRYDNKGRYAGEEQVGDSGTDNSSLKLPNFPTTVGGGTSIALTGQGTTNAGREGYSGVEVKQITQVNQPDTNYLSDKFNLYSSSVNTLLDTCAFNRYCYAYFVGSVASKSFEETMFMVNSLTTYMEYGLAWTSAPLQNQLNLWFETGKYYDPEYEFKSAQDFSRYLKTGYDENIAISNRFLNATREYSYQNSGFIDYGYDMGLVGLYGLKNTQEIDDAINEARRAGVEVYDTVTAVVGGFQVIKFIAKNGTVAAIKILGKSEKGVVWASKGTKLYEDMFLTLKKIEKPYGIPIPKEALSKLKTYATEGLEILVDGKKQKIIFEAEFRIPNFGGETNKDVAWYIKMIEEDKVVTKSMEVPTKSGKVKDWDFLPEDLKKNVYKNSFDEFIKKDSHRVVPDFNPKMPSEDRIKELIKNGDFENEDAIKKYFNSRVEDFKANEKLIKTGDYRSFEGQLVDAKTGKRIISDLDLHGFKCKPVKCTEVQSEAILEHLKNEKMCGTCSNYIANHDHELAGINTGTYQKKVDKGEKTYIENAYEQNKYATKAENEGIIRVDKDGGYFAEYDYKLVFKPSVYTAPLVVNTAEPTVFTESN